MWWWNFGKLLVQFAIFQTVYGDRYAVFKLPPDFRRSTNLADNFKRRNYAHIQIDVLIGAETAESSELVNLVVEDCSREYSLVISSLTKDGGRDMNGEPRDTKLENLLLVYDRASNINLDLVKTSFGERWNPRARVIALVEESDEETATETLSYFWKHDLLNVALTVENWLSSKIVENFIYNPFVPGNSTGTRGILVKLSSTESMFPDKLTNLHNHTIPISVFQHYPKALLDNFTSLQGGADVEVLWSIARKLNFSVGLKSAPVYGPSYTTTLSSGEQVGMLGDVLVNRSDIVLNSQYMETTSGRRVEFTYPTLQTGYCVLVPKAKMMPMIVRMLLPLRREVWFAVLVVVGFLLICFILMGEKKKLLKISALLIHFSFDKIPQRTFNRVFCISCIWWAYLVGCTYQANFIKELILPKYYKDLDTLEELYESKLPLTIGYNMMNVLNNSEVPVYKNLARRAVDHVVFDDCVNQLLAFFNVSCAIDQYISLLRAKFHTKNNTLLIHPVKECLSLHWDVYVAKYGFPLLDKFNQQIQSLLNTGLYSKWLNDILTAYWMPEDEREIAVLTMKHFEGIFAILLFGCGVSAMVFLLEFTTFHLFPKISFIFSRR